MSKSSKIMVILGGGSSCCCFSLLTVIGGQERNLGGKYLARVSQWMEALQGLPR